MESSGNLSYNKGVKSDKNWVIEESRFSRRELKKIEAIFTQGNGYLGPVSYTHLVTEKGNINSK